jgi:hypothetical protein
MSTGSDSLLKELRQLISENGSKLEKLQRAAALIRNSGAYRWVGLHEIDRQANEVFKATWPRADAGGGTEVIVRGN